MEVRQFDELTILEISSGNVVKLEGDTLSTTLHSSEDTEYETGMLDAFESFLLALHVQGVNFEDVKIKAAIETTVDAITNNMCG